MDVRVGTVVPSNCYMYRGPASHDMAEHHLLVGSGE